MASKDILMAGIEYATKQIAEDPTNASLYLERGRLYMMLDERAKAFEDLKQAASLDSSILENIQGKFSNVEEG